MNQGHIMKFSLRKLEREQKSAKSKNTLLKSNDNIFKKLLKRAVNVLVDR